MNCDSSYRLPKGFVWGCATASYQVEGAVAEEGRLPSVWDTFSHTPGKTFEGHTGDVACDQYHRFKDDVKLMVDLGFKAYRFSVAWPRVVPAGDGAVNPKGLDYYSRLVDALLAAGIEPFPTLYHWDLPQALEDKGGWRNRATVDAFTAYANAVARSLGDRVRNWFTLNEPWCFTRLGYETGLHAPGAKEPPKVVNQIIHHALLAHGAGVRAVRQFAMPAAKVGMAPNPGVAVPVVETPACIEAARRHWRRDNAQFIESILKGGYPQWWLDEQGDNAPKIERGDLEAMSPPTDFLAINVYSGGFVEPSDDPKGYRVLDLPKAYPRGDVPWLNWVPQAIYWAIRHAVEVYGVEKVYISENGSCWPDEMTADGRVIDLGRREMLREYLIQVQRAAAEGLPVAGYFVWTLMDNFEWAEGYAKRFGVCWTDFQTQQRTPKLSARWLSEVIKANRVL